MQIKSWRCFSVQALYAWRRHKTIIKSGKEKRRNSRASASMSFVGVVWFLLKSAHLRGKWSRSSMGVALIPARSIRHSCFMERTRTPVLRGCWCNFAHSRSSSTLRSLVCACYPTWRILNVIDPFGGWNKNVPIPESKRQHIYTYVHTWKGERQRHRRPAHKHPHRNLADSLSSLSSKSA